MQQTAFFSLAGPLDVLPASGQMRAANFNGFHELVCRLGGDSRQILEKFGIDPLAIGDADYLVHCMALGGVFEYCSNQLGRPLFGLDLAELQGPDVFGLVAAICRAAPTFGEAIRCFVKYLPVVHSPVSELALVEGDSVCELRFGGNAMVQDFDGCQIMFEGALLIHKLLREVGGPAFQPVYVSLANVPRSIEHDEIERRFGCHYRRNPGVNAIAFAAPMLHQPVAGSSRQLFLLLEGYLERLREASRVSLLERLEDCISSSFTTGHCSIEWCANKLGMSPRTLRIRLGKLDLKFSDVVERQRMAVAKAYLDRPDVTLDEVAFSLGYSEQSSFGRAFKRWTGVTPHAHRQDQKRFQA